MLSRSGGRHGWLLVAIAAGLVGAGVWAWTARESSEISVQIGVRSAEHDRLEVSLQTTDRDGQSEVLRIRGRNTIYPRVAAFGIDRPSFFHRNARGWSDLLAYSDPVGLGQSLTVARVRVEAEDVDDMRLSLVLSGAEEVELPPPRTVPLRTAEWQSEDWFWLPAQEVERHIRPTAASALIWVTIAAVPLVLLFGLVWFIRGGSAARVGRPRYLNTDFWLSPWT